MGTEDIETRPDGISRRDALKRGVKLTGAVLWATPVVQAIGMNPALAQTVSPPNGDCQDCCVHVTATGCDSINPNNTCFDDAGVPVPPRMSDAEEAVCCGLVERVSTIGTCWTIRLLGDCTVTRILVSAANQCDIDPSITNNPDGTITICNDSIQNQNQVLQDISHIEICFTCCPD